MGQPSVSDLDHPTAEHVPFVVETRSDAIKQLVDAEAGRFGTPTNWWPSDRSWFVYTDWDLWATKVSGPAALVDSIRKDDWLETIDWARLGNGGANGEAGG